jgi:hypothetical protein
MREGENNYELKHKVFKYIDKSKSEIIKFLSEYIKFKSITGEEEKVQKDFIVPFLEDMGLKNIELIALDKEKKGQMCSD